LLQSRCPAGLHWLRDRMAGLAGVNYFLRWRLSFLPVLSLHHWSTIAQSGAKGVRSSVSECC
jgi:hypothetical protein